MLQIETQGASELVSFRQKPTAGSLSTRQLEGMKGGRGGWKKKRGGGGGAGREGLKANPAGKQPM